MKQFNLIGGCCLSLALHAGLFLFAPAFSSSYQPAPDTVTEAELVELDVPIPPALQPSPEQPELAEDDTRALSASLSYDAAKIAPPDMQRINGAVEKVSVGLSTQFPTPVLQLPTQRQPVDPTLFVPPPSLEDYDMTAAILEQSLLAPGVLAGKDKHVGWGEVRLGNKQAPSRLGLPDLARQPNPQVLPQVPSTPVAPPLSPKRFGIQGPVAKREPLFRPVPPKVHVQMESEITLKFWVRPDGVVGRIVPERKGDAALEAVAIRYLERWRFTPLPLHESQVEQWGVITVRFLPS
jgi:TonB family protein